MDPDAALKELLLAVEDGDVDRVEELADGLNHWVARGGFPPRIAGSEQLGPIWHIAVMKAVIKLARAHVRVMASA